jgi:MFS family permease
LSIPSRERPSLLPIFLIVLVDVFGMTLVLPLLAIYAETFAATPLQATLLVSAFAACQLVSGPLIGYASDRTGRKLMLIVSQVGTLIGFIVLGRATALWMIFVSRIIDGSTAGNLSLAQAYIADNTPPQERGKAFGLIGIAFGLGFFVGPALTGLLSGRFGLRTPIYLASAMSFTSIVCTATLLKGDAPSVKSAADRWEALEWKTYAKYFARPGLRERLLQFLYFVLAFSTFISGFALFAERRFVWNGHPFGPREIGLLFGYFGFLGIILQGGFLGRLIKKFGEPTLVGVGFLSLAIGHVLLGLTGSVVLLVLASTAAAFGSGVIRPTLTSLISQHAGSEEQGVVLGLTQSLMSITAIVMPIVAGVLIEHRWLAVWAWVPAAAALCGLISARNTARAGAETPIPGLAGGVAID